MNWILLVLDLAYQGFGTIVRALVLFVDRFGSRKIWVKNPSLIWWGGYCLTKFLLL
jgi:hypothetical protein